MDFIPIAFYWSDDFRGIAILNFSNRMEDRSLLEITWSKYNVKWLFGLDLVWLNIVTPFEDE